MAAPSQSSLVGRLARLVFRLRRRVLTVFSESSHSSCDKETFIVVF